MPAMRLTISLLILICLATDALGQRPIAATPFEITPDTNGNVFFSANIDEACGQPRGTAHSAHVSPNGQYLLLASASCIEVVDARLRRIISRRSIASSSVEPSHLWTYVVANEARSRNGRKIRAYRFPGLQPVDSIAIRPDNVIAPRPTPTPFEADYIAEITRRETEEAIAGVAVETFFRNMLVDRDSTAVLAVVRGVFREVFVRARAASGRLLVVEARCFQVGNSNCEDIRTPDRHRFVLRSSDLAVLQYLQLRQYGYNRDDFGIDEDVIPTGTGFIERRGLQLSHFTIAAEADSLSVEWSRPLSSSLRDWRSRHISLSADGSFVTVNSPGGVEFISVHDGASAYFLPNTPGLTKRHFYAENICQYNFDSNCTLRGFASGLAPDLVAALKFFPGSGYNTIARSELYLGFAMPSSSYDQASGMQRASLGPRSEFESSADYRSRLITGIDSIQRSTTAGVEASRPLLDSARTEIPESSLKLGRYFADYGVFSVIVDGVPYLLPMPVNVARQVRARPGELKASGNALRRAGSASESYFNVEFTHPAFGKRKTGLQGVGRSPAL